MSPIHRHGLVQEMQVLAFTRRLCGRLLKPCNEFIERAQIMSKRNTNGEEASRELRNEDPLSGEAGAHPIGTGVGAALGGAAAGAAAGAFGGPVGAVVGAIVGGVAGGYAGKAAAESVDPTVEVTYWKSEYQSRPYHNENYSYDHYHPAYKAGWEAYDGSDPADWTRRETIARERWESEGGPQYMSWEEARFAAMDAYDKVHAQDGSARS